MISVNRKLFLLCCKCIVFLQQQLILGGKMWQLQLNNLQFLLMILCIFISVHYDSLFSSFKPIQQHFPSLFLLMNWVLMVSHIIITCLNEWENVALALQTSFVNSQQMVEFVRQNIHILLVGIGRYCFSTALQITN